MTAGRTTYQQCQNEEKHKVDMVHSSCDCLSSCGVGVYGVGSWVEVWVPENYGVSLNHDHHLSAGVDKHHRQNLTLNVFAQ
jgi:hypothetical protein